MSLLHLVIAFLRESPYIGRDKGIVICLSIQLGIYLAKVYLRTNMCATLSITAYRSTYTLLLDSTTLHCWPLITNKEKWSPYENKRS